MRSADQFVHTGLKNADEVHQLAHELLQHWEKFARSLDQRRKLLSLVVSFNKQTESASEKLEMLEKEIKKEEGKIGQTKIDVLSSDEKISNLHSNLSNQIAEITAPCIREGKILLEKIDKDDDESQFIIRRVSKAQQCSNEKIDNFFFQKVSEFNEQVNVLKSKIVNKIH